MKSKTRAGSKIPTTQTNTNQKKKAKPAQGTGLATSLLKKNEFALIIAGALLVTVLVFFLFFRTPAPKPGSSPAQAGSKQVIPAGLEKRVAALEVSFSKLASAPQGIENASSGAEVSDLEQRITRLETAVSLKMDALIDRMATLEARLAKQARTLKSAPQVPRPPEKTVSAPSIPKKAPATKKPALPKKKAALFHTVKKGETLWSISQKYNTSVAAIRKLNNMSPTDRIYPGNNLLVR